MCYHCSVVNCSVYVFIDVMMNKFRAVSHSRQTAVTVKYTNIHISTYTISVDILIVHMQLGTIPLYDSKL